eukprot:CAMPEP_0206267622 /NCGR_PEP_ID=MMETSP0047_2-20121206/31250_1 /ASSEMBLY_ACC=CAM_ASM_000192 /TAXON_ID=195065 /ORGANISM="Chroomonas mesostigmatica_cf, Strain CCMP1168" /LENGTH=135 /DNA_ID=CAMNT_0053695843 /DNA_START=136 /DNA_END=539 /DNA_ORIENTATION=-
MSALHRRRSLGEANPERQSRDSRGWRGAQSPTPTSKWCGRLKAAAPCVWSCPPRAAAALECPGVAPRATPPAASVCGWSCPPRAAAPESPAVAAPQRPGLSAPEAAPECPAAAPPAASHAASAAASAYPSASAPP